MKTRPILVSFAAVTLAGALQFAFPQATKQAEEPLKWGTESHGCRVAVRKAPTTTPAGEPVDIEVVVRHCGTGEAIMTEVRSHPYNMFTVEALLDGKDRVSHTAYADEKEFDCNGVIQGLLRNPEDLKRTIRVNRMVDMSRPGKYQVTIGFKFRGNFGGEYGPVKVETPPFEVDVEEKGE